MRITRDWRWDATKSGVQVPQGFPSVTGTVFYDEASMKLWGWASVVPIHIWSVPVSPHT